MYEGNYELGKERPDGKFNVWRKALIDNDRFEWVIVNVCDDLDDANDFLATRRAYRVRRGGK